jgi:Uma2 family endonuclease
MSQIIEVVERYEIPDFPDPADFPEEDGVPLETNWHRAQINLLIEVVTHRWRDRQDFFAGGNMFVYYSVHQARNRDYKGPDFFVVKGVDGSYSRGKWVVWEENGRLPDVIVELMSPSTAHEDLGSKKELYERTFRTPEYFCYDPDEHQLWGWRLVGQAYVPLESNNQGRLWSVALDASIGLWEGEYLSQQAAWLRLYDEDDQLIPTGEEANMVLAAVERQRADMERRRANQESQRADQERQRAEAAEAENARLRAELAKLQGKQE